MLRAGEIAAASVGEEQGHQPAAGARRQREPAGDAAGALRRGQSPALTELGVNLFVNRERFAARSTTQQFAAPDFDDTEAKRPRRSAIS